MSFRLIQTALTILILPSFLITGCNKEVVSHDIDAEIQRIMMENDLPSISACVVKDNKIVWKNSYGWSDIENQVTATEETIYHIASISKLFIATAIMQLEEEGRLNLEDDINNYLPISLRNPRFPDNPITIKMLLMHTSGVAWPQIYQEALGLWEQFDPDQAPYPSEWVPQFLLPSGENYNPRIWKNTAPGTFELYSNIGSNVLAYIIEQISQQNFREYCMEYIFIPLNMSKTSYNYSDLNPNELAVLYKDNNSIRAPFDDRLYASGGLKTSVHDLSRFIMTYNNKGTIDGKRILKEATIEKLLKLQSATSGRCLMWEATVGGWRGHTGGIEGSATVTEIHPDSKRGIIIFCNKHSNIVYPGHEIYKLVRQKANEFIH